MMTIKCHQKFIQLSFLRAVLAAYRLNVKGKDQSLVYTINRGMKSLQ